MEVMATNASTCSLFYNHYTNQYFSTVIPTTHPQKAETSEGLSLSNADDVEWFKKKLISMN